MTNYDRQGSGPTLVLVHGWGDTLKSFDDLTSRLAQNHDVIRLDLPGFGGSEAPKDVWNLDKYAQFLADFLAKLNISNYALIGHSNGGAVIIRGVGLGLLQPRRLILLASSGVRSGGGLRRAVIKIIAKVGKVATFWLPLRVRRHLQEKLYGAAGSDMLVAPHLKETFKITVRQDIQRDARKITAPTLLLYGDSDRATSVTEVGNRLHKCISGSKLVIVPNADHFVHQPADNVLHEIEAFTA